MESKRCKNGGCNYPEITKMLPWAGPGVSGPRLFSR